MLGTTQPTHATASLHQASFRLRKTLIWTGYDRKPYGKHQFLEVPRMSRFRGDKKNAFRAGKTLIILGLPKKSDDLAWAGQPGFPRIGLVYAKRYLFSEMTPLSSKMLIFVMTTSRRSALSNCQ